VTPIGFLPRSCVRLVPESTRQEIGRRLFVSPRNERRNVSVIALRDCRGSERIVAEGAAHQRKRIAQGDAADEEDRRAPRGRRISSETRSKSRIRRAANSSKRVNRAGQSRRHPLNEDHPRFDGDIKRVAYRSAGPLKVLSQLARD